MYHLIGKWLFGENNSGCELTKYYCSETNKMIWIDHNNASYSKQCVELGETLYIKECFDKSNSRIYVINTFTKKRIDVVPTTWGNDLEGYYKYLYPNQDNTGFTFMSYQDFHTYINSVGNDKAVQIYNLKHTNNQILQVQEDIVNIIQNVSRCTQQIQSVSKKTTSNKHDIDAIQENIAVVLDEMKQLINDRKILETNLIDSDVKSINPENLLNECVAFHKSNNMLYNSDIISTIKLMLNSKRYILSKDFKNNKVDLHELSFEYKMLTKPDDITREELLDVIFNINNSSLI